jgi:CBS domain-containing protein
MIAAPLDPATGRFADMKVRDVMTRRVISVRPETPLLEAGALMLAHHISGLPVIDANGQVVGIVTERDFLRPRGDQTAPRPRWFELIGSSQLAERCADCRSRTVAEVMTPAPLTVTEDTSLEQVVNLIEEHDVKRLPVVRDGRLVGVVARADLIRALVSAIRRASDLAIEDLSERARLLELERQAWMQRARQMT